MRKFSTLLAVSALALVVTASAWAVNADQGLSISVSPSKAGTKTKPKSVKLKITTTTTPKDSAQFSTTKAVLSFDKNLKFGGSKFKTCTLATVQSDETKCPKGSKVGSGSAKAQAGPGGQLKVPSISVTAFNASKGKALLLHVIYGPLNIDQVLNAKISKGSGAYGTKLTVPINAALQSPAPGLFATLTEFITSVSGHATDKAKTPYVGLTGCSGGSLKFQGVFTYNDGSSKTATASAKCSK
jgi:hypothetical protein